MDDGAQKWEKKSLGVRFCTDNFSEVLILTSLLKHKYNYKSFTQKKGGNYRIYISSTSYFLLKNLIYVYLVPCMLYKFPVDSSDKTCEKT